MSLEMSPNVTGVVQIDIIEISCQKEPSPLTLIAAGAVLLLVSLALRLLLPENGESISAPLNLGGLRGRGAGVSVPQPVTAVDVYAIDILHEEWIEGVRTTDADPPGRTRRVSPGGQTFFRQFLFRLFLRPARTAPSALSALAVPFPIRGPYPQSPAGYPRECGPYPQSPAGCPPE